MSFICKTINISDYKASFHLTVSLQDNRYYRTPKSRPKFQIFKNGNISWQKSATLVALPWKYNSLLKKQNFPNLAKNRPKLT